MGFRFSVSEVLTKQLLRMSNKEFSQTLPQIAKSINQIDSGG
jgi:hypothetical protein